MCVRVCADICAAEQHVHADRVLVEVPVAPAGRVFAGVGAALVFLMRHRLEVLQDGEGRGVSCTRSNLPAGERARHPATARQVLVSGSFAASTLASMRPRA